MAVVDTCHRARWWEAVERPMRADKGEEIAEVKNWRQRGRQQRQAGMHFPIGWKSQ